MSQIANLPQEAGGKRPNNVTNKFKAGTPRDSLGYTAAIPGAIRDDQPRIAVGLFVNKLYILFSSTPFRPELAELDDLLTFVTP